MSDDEREERELDLTSPEVVTKYKSAAEIVNKALQLVLSLCKPKVKVVDLCEKGDAFIREQTGNMYKNVKKKIERGVAFPTCISLNNTVCHFSPLSGDEVVLEEGDMLKIDMGCHIDGFIAVVAHTHVLQEGPVTGRAADVIAAANTAAEVALRLVRPGKKNSDVTEAIQKVAAAYDCKIVEGVLSHQMKQFVIDGNKVVLNVSNPETRVDDAEFEENEVYSIDIVTSTGDGKPKLLDEKQTTIYKRAVDKSYNLKMKASRFIFSEISQKFPIMPFTARDLEEKRARLGRSIHFLSAFNSIQLSKLKFSPKPLVFRFRSYYQGRMNSMRIAALPILGFMLMALQLQLGSGQVTAPSPAPVAPSNDGVAIDQGIAYVLLMLALAITYLVH